MPVTPIPAAIAPSGIKSIQRGVLTIPAGVMTATATIAAVNTAKTQVAFVGQNISAASANFIASLQLTNATTLTATRTYQDSGSVTNISFEVTEWY